ncbi:MAG: cyclic nucleotide-binding domain-containing protein [Syntrophobacteraceae bacterium]|jgi:NTE family protein/lysophospholipid hydrolase
MKDKPTGDPGNTMFMDLSQGLEPVTLDAGATLFRQGDPGDAIYVVTTGQLAVTIKQEDGSEWEVGVIDQGEVAGEIPNLSGGKRRASVHAVCQTNLLKLSKSSFTKLGPGDIEGLYEIMRRQLCRNQLVMILQDLFGTMSKDLLKRIDSYLQWHRLKRGEILFRQGDRGDRLYIIVSGRLQVVADDEDGETRTVERARGEVIGEMALLLGGHRTATVRCVRDSYLVSISRDAAERLVEEHPEVMLGITRMLARRVQQGMHALKRKRTGMSIAVIAAQPGAPLSEFSHRLGKMLMEFASTLHLNSRRVDSLVQVENISQVGDDDPYRMSLSIWLDEQETKHEFILYEADMSRTSWTNRCLKQADHILILARAPDILAVDSNIDAMMGPAGDMDTTKRTLILLHPDRSRLPSETKQWKELLQAQNHHHLAGESDAQYRRLARILTGKAVGVVLSGGGACGFAHIGVIRALEEAGVPIDLIGGTSMGAAISAQYAMGMTWEEMVRLGRKMFIDSKPFRDFTIPYFSFIGSRKFDDTLKKLYGEKMIEDLWVNYFCISTNLTTAKPVVHDHGPLRKAVRASTSLPGIVEPVIQGNELLVDGGVLNNLPVDVMQDLWDCSIIAVNASGGAEVFSVQREKVPSPLELLRSFVRPSSNIVRFPNLFDIISRTTTVSSVHKTNFARTAASLFLRPPVSGLGLLNFTAIDQIVAIGYEYAREKIGEWKEKFNIG